MKHFPSQDHLPSVERHRTVRFHLLPWMLSCSSDTVWQAVMIAGFDGLGFAMTDLFFSGGNKTMVHAVWRQPMTCQTTRSASELAGITAANRILACHLKVLAARQRNLHRFSEAWVNSGFGVAHPASPISGGPKVAAARLGWRDFCENSNRRSSIF